MRQLHLHNIAGVTKYAIKNGLTGTDPPGVHVAIRSSAIAYNARSSPVQLIVAADPTGSHLTSHAWCLHIHVHASGITNDS
jgi:hypothetical protein